jgi:AraC-like DNA-binding protein
MKEPFSTTLWRDAALGSAEFLRGSFTDFAYAPHTHDVACITLLTRGQIRIRMHGREHVWRQGDMFAAAPGEVHEGWPIDKAGWSLRTLYLDLGQVQELMDAPATACRTLSLSGPWLRDPDLAARFLAAHRASESASLANVSPLARQEAFLDFATHLLQRYARPVSLDKRLRHEPAAVRRAKAFLDDHLDVRVSLADVATASGLTPFRLLRAFTRAEGLSPHAYQRQARLHRAMAWMRQGRALGDIAAASGFADQAHLTRIFRQAMGMTPGAYRRACVSTRTAPFGPAPLTSTRTDLPIASSSGAR